MTAAIAERTQPATATQGEAIAVSRLKALAQRGEVRLWYDQEDRNWCVSARAGDTDQVYRHRQAGRALALAFRAMDEFKSAAKPASRASKTRSPTAESTA